MLNTPNPSVVSLQLSPRDRRAVDTRARVCEASLSIVTAEGFEALTMQRLGRELGCAPGGIYRYFPSKSAIVLALLHQVLAGFVADLGAARERMDASRAIHKLSDAERALVRAILVFETYVSLRDRRPAHMQLVTLALGDPNDLVENPEGSSPEMFHSLLAIAAECSHSMREAASAGLLRDDADGAQRVLTLFGALQGVLQLRKLERLQSLGIDSAAMARGVIDAMFRAWGAEPDALSQAHRHARRLAA